jgi:hypothetical protein
MGFSKIENLIIIVLKYCGSVPAIVGWQNRFLLLRVFFGVLSILICNEFLCWPKKRPEQKAMPA